MTAARALVAACAEAASDDELGAAFDAFLSASDADPSALLGGVASPDPQTAAICALALGALVEGGLPAAPVADPLVAASLSALELARRFLVRCRAHGTDDDATPPDGPSPLLGDREVLLTGYRLTPNALHRLARLDPPAARAWDRLDLFLRALVAVGARTPLPRQGALRAALDAVEVEESGAFSFLGHARAGGELRRQLTNPSPR